MNEKQFNKRYPVGTPVKYFPIAGEPNFEETTTRSEAWTLGSGHVVVKVVGHAGGISIDHILPNIACTGQVAGAGKADGESTPSATCQ